MYILLASRYVFYPGCIRIYSGLGVSTQHKRELSSELQVTLKCTSGAGLKWIVSELITRVNKFASVWTMNPDSSQLDVMRMHIDITKFPLFGNTYLDNNLRTKLSSSNYFLYRNFFATLFFYWFKETCV